ncbi:MAG: hypothetical protein OEV78_06185 [Spirochaetia bacterium]|nr:hypothetical protein [Spirochaetia bacterium]
METKNKYNSDNFIKDIKLFLLTGPTLLVWISAIVHYPKNSKYFLLSIQNALISVIFIFIYSFFIVINLFFQIPSESSLLIIESTLSTIYLIITLYCFYLFRQKEKIALSKIVDSLLDRVFLVETL